jgi:hypothetical protein
MSSGTAVDGFGPAIDFRGENLAGTGPTIVGRIATVFKNTGWSNQEGEMSLWTASDSTLYRQLTLSPGAGAAGTSTFAGRVIVSSTTASTSTTSGALQVVGGVGVAGALFAGGAGAFGGTVTVSTGGTGSGFSIVRTGVAPSTFTQLNSGGEIISAYDGVNFRWDIGGATKLTLGATTATFAGAIAIGNTVNTVSPTSPDRTITIVVGGTTYYIAAKTTND